MKQLLVPSDPIDFKRNNLDAIRLMMALLVVWSHCFALYLGSEITEPIATLMNGTYNAGNIGVMVFFIISGFLVSNSFIRSKSLKRFFERRVRRIFPGYLVATSVCAFVILPLYSTIRNLSVWEIAKTLGANLLLRNYFPPSNAFTTNVAPNVINGSLWSIPFEFWCYIGVAALGILYLLSRRWFVAFVTISVLIGRVILDALGKKPGGGIIELIIGWPYEWFVILPSFLLGMVTLAFRGALPRSRVLLSGLTISAIMSGWLSPYLAHLLVAPALAYITFYFSFHDSIALDGLTRWGDFSYGTYLYAWPIQQMLALPSKTKFPFPIYILFSMILALMAGMISWHFIEKPFLLRDRTRRHPQQSNDRPSDSNPPGECF